MTPIVDDELCVRIVVKGQELVQNRDHLVFGTWRLSVEEFGLYFKAELIFEDDLQIT